MKAFPTDAVELINSRHTLAIATYSDEKIYPEVATIYYVFLDNELYIVAHPNTAKVKNILSNGKLALVITDETTPKTLQIEGTGEIIIDKPLMEKVITEYERLTTLLTNDSSSIIETPGDTLVVIRCVANWFRFTNYAEKIVEEKL